MIVHYLIIFIIAAKAYCDIRLSSDLNCDFIEICLWRNATIGNTGYFSTSNHVKINQDVSISPKNRATRKDFAYANSKTIGWQQATLVSDLIGCQLGGASLSFWYYRTGYVSSIDVCWRMPPGSIDSLAIKCYPVIVGNHVRQWIYSVIELPPISTPFELHIRVTFILPSDVVAIDDILFNAILCGSIDSPHEKQKNNSEKWNGQISCGRAISSKHIQRSSRIKRDFLFTPPPLINYADWNLIKASNSSHPTMIVVSELSGVQAESDQFQDFEFVANGNTEPPNSVLLDSESLKNTSIRFVARAISEIDTAASFGEEDIESKSKSNGEKKFVSWKEIPIIPIVVEPIRDQRIPIKDSLKATTTPSHTTKLPIESPFRKLIDAFERIAPVIPAFAYALRPTIDEDTIQSSALKSVNAISNVRFNNLKGARSTTSHPRTAQYSTNTTKTWTEKIARNRSPIHSILKIRKLRTNDFGLEQTIKISQAAKFNHYSALNHQDIQTRLANMVNSSKFQRGSGAHFMTHNKSAFVSKPLPVFSPTPRPYVGANQSEELSVAKNFKGSSTVNSSYDISELDAQQQEKVKEYQLKIFGSESSKHAIGTKDSLQGTATISGSINEVNHSTIMPEIQNRIQQDDLDAFLNSEDNERIRKFVDTLPKNVANELELLKSIPNPKELLTGLNLNLLMEKNGYKRLKKQFIQRYLQRSMGIYP